MSALLLDCQCGPLPERSIVLVACLDPDDRRVESFFVTSCLSDCLSIHARLFGFRKLSEMICAADKSGEYSSASLERIKVRLRPD
ncbi:uncharacterized protein MYCGRDRAFT_78335 [Zymoseptoria tritici IPO323]|uniref:Uncharacterized protein n=1 Tax=Zymoseptoria tritici (strain CBS 115943 / IPO323) TaxID=336722 RepID=F9WXV4_ZYMTI|nr:uncharacterized protein MYCGRDRAFT_78335 [Zymoseptoria tritici IPO323]EGP91094.1 hypothetical protein MYCGRDRAFT_78335 [Zymoseptoria tritici IPO323]